MSRIPNELREARSCYDHLAGVAGVALHDAMLSQGWIEPIYDKTGKLQPSYRLTERGRDGLIQRGVLLPRGSSRRFAYACPDWTEPGAHIGGALGAAILGRLQGIGVVEAVPGQRPLHLTGDVVGWVTGKPK